MSSGSYSATGGNVGENNTNSGIRNFKQAIKIPKATYQYLEFLQPDTRLFNKVLVPVPSGDETLQALRVVASTIVIALHSVGNKLELIEINPPLKLQRLRQANLPKAYQPTIDLHSLGSGLRAMGRRRESQISQHSRRRMSRTHSIHDSVPNIHSIKTIQSTTIHTDDDNNQLASFSKLNGNLIKQRLKQIKLPKISFNFGRNMRSTVEQSGNEEPTILEKVNNTEQVKDESKSETIDCRGFCSPKLKLKHKNKNHIHTKNDDHNDDEDNNDVDVDDDDDDGERDEETEDTDNSHCTGDETDIDLTDDDSLSEDNHHQSKNRLITTYQLSTEFPKFRRSTYHSVDESYTHKNHIVPIALHQSLFSTSIAQWRKYSHSESDLLKKFPVFTLSSTSSSYNNYSPGSHCQQNRQYKSRKKLMRESYQAINKSKLSLELNRTIGDNKNESTIITQEVPQVYVDGMNPIGNEKQINLELATATTTTLEQLLYGNNSNNSSYIGNINDGIDHIQQYDNTNTIDHTIPFNYMNNNNNIFYERIQQLLKVYTQTNMMKCILFSSEYNNSCNGNTNHNINDNILPSSCNMTLSSINHQSIGYKDNDLYELLKHIYLPEINLIKSSKLTAKLKRKQICSLIYLNSIRRELGLSSKNNNNNNKDENEKLQTKMTYSSFILF
ncbi:unnamed protein product [Schistosoma turkestanicum]|nr:unnamed protein product [Schistosoma turkestanicum]